MESSRLVSRSASLMMTRVYSRSAGSSSSRSSSCAAPRRPPKRIFDFVRELADHQAATAQLRKQRVLAGEPPVLRDVLDFQEQNPALPTEPDLRDRAIEDPVDAARRRPGEFALHHAFAALPGAFEQGQQGLGAAA